MCRERRRGRRLPPTRHLKVMKTQQHAFGRILSSLSMPNLGCGSDLLVALSRFATMMVDSGMEKPSNDKKGHCLAGIYGQYLEEDREAVRKTRRSLVSWNWSREAWWEESRTQSEVRGAQGLQNQSKHDLLPGALHLPREEECDCSVLSCSLSPSCQLALD